MLVCSGKNVGQGPDVVGELHHYGNHTFVAILHCNGLKSSHKLNATDAERAKVEFVLVMQSRREQAREVSEDARGAT